MLDEFNLSTNNNPKESITRFYGTTIIDDICSSSTHTFELQTYICYLSYYKSKESMIELYNEKLIYKTLV